MKIHLKHTHFAKEMIQTIEAGMSRKEIRAFYAELPKLLEVEAKQVHKVFEVWAGAYRCGDSYGIAYANLGLITPGYPFISDIIVVAGYEPHGLFRIPENEETIGLSLKGLLLTFVSDNSVSGCTPIECRIHEHHIRIAVQRLLFIHRNPEFSPARIL